MQKPTDKDKEMVAKKLRLFFLDIQTAVAPTADPTVGKSKKKSLSFLPDISLSLAVDFWY